MPELPEVEITCQSLKEPLLNSTFTDVLTRRNGLRYPFPKYFKEYLIHYKVISLYRKAKYIIIGLEHSVNLVIHLGMSGRLKILDDTPCNLNKHDHVVFTMKTMQGRSFTLIYTDPRRFGLIDIIKAEDLLNHRYFKHLGPDPFDDSFTIDQFAIRLKKSKKTLKQTLLDQRVLAGIGNIYACEALFYAKLSPYRFSCDLTAEEYENLYNAIRYILKKAISAGGSSFKDYQHIDGTKGEFQSYFTVYDKHHHSCPRCVTTPLQRVIQQGRSTFYCTLCQK